MDLLQKRCRSIGEPATSRRLNELAAAQHLPKVIGFGVGQAIANGNLVQLIPDEDTVEQLRPELELIQGYFPSNKSEIFVPKLTLSTSRDSSFVVESAMIIDAYAASHPGIYPITLGELQIET